VRARKFRRQASVSVCFTTVRRPPRAAHR